MTGLVRFRADPDKVRVAVRRTPLGWQATIMNRVGYGIPRQIALVKHKSAIRAVALALRKAERLGIPGIDIDMQWAYPHPWRSHEVRRVS